MKIPINSLLRHAGVIALTMFPTLGLCGNAPSTEVVWRDAVSHEELSHRLPKIEQEDPMKSLAASKLEDPVKNAPKDLLSHSDIISFGGNATLVPKRAIVQIPKNYADRIKFVQGSQIMGWTDFYALNRGWITTVEISRKQAEGNESIPEGASKVLSKSGNLIVAVYKGGPISMLPLKVPVEKTGTASAKP